MKKVTLIIVMLSFIASAGYAAPLSDYSAGKGSIDLTWNVSSKIESYYNRLGIFLPESANNKFNGGLTLGLGNNLAFQYKNRQGASSPLPGRTGPLSSYNWVFTGLGPGIPSVHDISVSVYRRIQADEYNLLHKLNPNLSVFAGAVSVKGVNSWDGSIDYIFGSGSHFIDPTAGSDSKSSNGYQIGFVASAKLDDKMTGWTIVGVGNKINSWELGMGYRVAENLDLNLSYSHVKYKDLNTRLLGFTLDSLTMSGVGIGLTYVF